MAKAIRKEPLGLKFSKLVKEQSDMLKGQADRTDRLFNIIKQMEITINNQHQLIAELSKSLEDANKMIADLIEKGFDKK